MPQVGFEPLLVDDTSYEAATNQATTTGLP